MKQVIPILIVSLIVGGCDKLGNGASTTPAKTVAAADLPAGWKRLEDPASHLSIGVAPGWAGIDMSPAEFAKSLKAATVTDPELAKEPDQVKAILSNGSIKLVVMHPKDPKTGFAANINILTLPLPSAMELKAVVDANLSSMKAIAKGDIKREPVKLGDVDAELLRWTHPAQGPKGPLELQQLTYIAVDPSAYYVVTATIPPGVPASVTTESEQMAKTFKIH